MLKLMMLTTSITLTAWFSPFKFLWPAVLLHSMIVTLYSLKVFTSLMYNTWGYVFTPLMVDPISLPLVTLTCWLLPLYLLASQNHASSTPPTQQRIFITLLISLQVFLITAFSSSELLLFYVAFEATLIPTLLLIVRWGNQTERLDAGTYLLFFTLTASIPLLIALIVMMEKLGSLSYPLLKLWSISVQPSMTEFFWWMALFAAFLLKLPLFSLHLWLPKAHVEAPVGGSMVLAAVLLKLGGFGMIRLMTVIPPPQKEIVYPIMILALWGVIMAGVMCLRQTDLKSLIAYSSVGHMGLVACGILAQTDWATTGAMVLMIGHALTSSALFCLANTNYERTSSRTLILTRGLETLLPLMGAWWLIMSLSSMGVPPLPNLMGELSIMCALINWSKLTTPLLGAGAIITAAYSLHMYLVTQRGPIPPHLVNLDPTHTREHLLLTLHLLPLLLLILKPQLMWGWAL
nr:NADH dehydrogenase subunit 4 [Lophogobius cyprinoides]